MSDNGDVSVAYNWHSVLGHLMLSDYYTTTGYPAEAFPFGEHSGKRIRAVTGCPCGEAICVPLGGDFTCECGRVFRAQVLIEYREKA